ncbi:hypothetical protein [Alicyclobacillus ferrooxydans]|uniref:hypothetical protein n=1 Tax=Alicyclobacillus ferrooxydans TaxID=471514 RepID=UPI000B1C3ADC|nr:hypothetical protein [Alicyclobacillus ferrooxydans]
MNYVRTLYHSDGKVCRVLAVNGQVQAARAQGYNVQGGGWRVQGAGCKVQGYKRRYFPYYKKAGKADWIADETSAIIRISVN